MWATYCNEEGKLLGLPVNRAATSMIDFDDVVVGDVVVMELEEEKEEDDEDMSEAATRHFQEHLWNCFERWCHQSVSSTKPTSLEAWLGEEEEIIKTGMRAMWHEKNGARKNEGRTQRTVERDFGKARCEDRL